LSDWSQRGLEWANFASEEALRYADMPCIETIQACQNLATYWYAVGELYRANFHQGQQLLEMYNFTTDSGGNFI
jgi:hypothetical protein